MPSSQLAPAGGFRRIAVLRLSSLGDVVLTLPVVHALKRAFPEATLDFWTKEEYRDVLESDPAVGHVRALEKDARRVEDLVSMSAELEDCDLIVDLHGVVRTRMLTFRQKAPILRVGSTRILRARWVHARWTRPRPAPHATARYAAAIAPLGIPVEGPPRVAIAPAEAAWASEWLAQAGWTRPPVALAPGALHWTKRWPERHWVDLLARLAAAGHPVLVVSLAAERSALPALAAAVDRAGAGSRWCVEPLARIAALLARCRTAIACDSGLMHLAAATGIPVVALFGSTAPELGFAPSGAGHTVLCRHEPCQPCTLHGRESCPKGHFRCMELLEPDQVVAALAAPRT